MRLLCAVFLLVASASAALAQSPRAPEIVIPSRPDVPVFMYGTDLSWSVVESDFGLDRPGEMTPTVIYRPFGTPYIFLPPPRLHYFPTSNERPGYGRLEIVPPADRPLPPPAKSFRQGWEAESAPLPANDPSSFGPTGFSPYGMDPGSMMGPRFDGSPQGYGYPPFQGYGYNGSPFGGSFGQSRNGGSLIPPPFN